MEYIIPAVIIFVGNLFSGSPGSRPWELISATFGWVGGTALLLWLVFSVVGSEFWARQIFFPVGALCLVQILSRDGLRILKPLADRWLKGRGLDD